MKQLTKADYLPDLRELEKLFDEHKDTYTEAKLRERGAADGADNIPRGDATEPCPFESELTFAVSALAGKVASAFTAALELLDARVKAEESKYKAEHEDELANIERRYAIDTDASENHFGLTDAHKRLASAEQKYEEHYARHGRVPVRYVPHWLYVIFALAIFLGEIPLNALVFQLFGENQVMTWVMAFVIGLSIPLTAHFIGIKMREHGNGFSVGNALKGFAAFAVITIALYGLSMLRQTYLGEFKSELGLTDVLVERSFLFFWLNMAVFVAAIFVSYLAHDSVVGYDNLEYEQKNSKKDVHKHEKRRVSELVKSGREKSDAILKARTQFRDNMLNVTMMKGVYDQVLREGQAHERRCQDLLGLQTSIYRHENLRVRKDGANPPSFKTKLDFPLHLRDMQEKLVNDDRPVEPRTNA